MISLETSNQISKVAMFPTNEKPVDKESPAIDDVSTSDDCVVTGVKSSEEDAIGGHEVNVTNGGLVKVKIEKP